MEATQISTAIAKLSAQVEDVLIALGEIRMSMDSARLQKIEASLGDLNLKFDSLNAIDIAPQSASSSAAVRVAAVTGGSAATSTTITIKQNITDFFKTQWVTSRQSLIDKGVVDEALIQRVISENQSKLEKKNDVTREKAIATAIWRIIAADKKEIVRAMKVECAADTQKNNSIEVLEESAQG